MATNGARPGRRPIDKVYEGPPTSKLQLTDVASFQKTFNLRKRSPLYCPPSICRYESGVRNASERGPIHLYALTNPPCSQSPLRCWTSLSSTRPYASQAASDFYRDRDPWVPVLAANLKAVWRRSGFLGGASGCVDGPAGGSSGRWRG